VSLGLRWTLWSIGSLALASAAVDSASADEVVPVGSIRDGVFTAEQAGRGEFVYPVACGKCHGYRLDGAPDDDDMFSTPPIGGPKFLRNWGGRTLAALYEYTRTTMPANNPGFLADQEFADVLAYMLSQSGMPAGRGELRPDAAGLAGIVIEAGS
jgi:mono/diheme cytochrome c family protein